MGEEKGAWLHDGVFFSHEGGKYVFIGDRVCARACVSVCVKVKGRCGEEGSSGRGNKNSLGCVCESQL